MKKNATSPQGQVILAQHNIEASSPVEGEAGQAILVPLDLADLTILHQERQPDGSLEIHVRASTDRANCPRCQTTCVKVHDTRPRRKRDIPVRDYPVRLILYTRRFRCLTCQRSFTEPDSVCGRYKRTTQRFRNELGQQASRSTLTQVAHDAHTGTRFVQDCLTTWGHEKLARAGRSVSEARKLSTPCFLGIDEFARRKGHRYDPILCDLQTRTVVAASEGRTQDEVVKLLERLDESDGVKAVSMDMSACARPAMHLCLPHAQIVVDHFHVIQHGMKAFRKIVSSWVHKKEGKLLLQGKQHLFLMAQETLTEEQQQERSSTTARGVAAQRSSPNVVRYLLSCHCCFRFRCLARAGATQ